MISLEEKGMLSPSKSAAAELLSDYIDEIFDFRFGERRLRDFYNAALRNEEIEIKQQPVRDGLAHYLGFENFEQWLLPIKKKNGGKELRAVKKNNPINILLFLKKNKTSFLITLFGLIIFLIINSINNEKWMEWNGNQFVETDYDEHKIERGNIFLFNGNKIERFKKIDPDCETDFFNAEGNAQLWYGKNKKGELEYFTDLGRHPETGKTLRPITKYMINKYICAEGN